MTSWVEARWMSSHPDQIRAAIPTPLSMTPGQHFPRAATADALMRRAPWHDEILVRDEILRWDVMSSLSFTDDKTHCSSCFLFASLRKCHAVAAVPSVALLRAAVLKGGVLGFRRSPEPKGTLKDFFRQWPQEKGAYMTGVLNFRTPDFPAPMVYCSNRPILGQPIESRKW